MDDPVVVGHYRTPNLSIQIKAMPEETKPQISREVLNQLQHELSSSVKVQVHRLLEVEDCEEKLRLAEQELKMAKESLKNGVDHTKLCIEKFRVSPESIGQWWPFETSYIFKSTPYRLDCDGRVNKSSATKLDSL